MSWSLIYAPAEAVSPHGYIKMSIDVLHLKLFEQSQLPPHSSWLYSDKMHNVNTEESLLFPSISCANVKGCYEVLWVKEIVLSCIQILSTCVCLPTLKLSLKIKTKNICGFSIGFEEINTYAELHMKLGPVTLGRLVLLLSQQKKFPEKDWHLKLFISYQCAGVALMILCSRYQLH